MKTKYKIEDVEVKIPALDIDVKVGKLSYALEDVTPQDIADAGVTIINSIVGMAQSLFPDEFAFSSFDSGNACHGVHFSTGDYVTEEGFAGTVVSTDEHNGTVTYIIQEVENKANQGLIGDSTIAFVDALSFIDPGDLSRNAVYTVSTEPSNIDEELPFKAGARQDEMNEASDINQSMDEFATKS